MGELIGMIVKNGRIVSFPLIAKGGPGSGRYPSGSGGKEASGPPKEISTSKGKAGYLRTEKENADGKWNDSYTTEEGYHVTHPGGGEHHVYLLKPTQTEINNAVADADEKELKASGRVPAPDWVRQADFRSKGGGKGIVTDKDQPNYGVK